MNPREIDALIAGHVFGITKKTEGCLCAIYERCSGCTYPLYYSTSIADAFLVVEKMREKSSGHDWFTLQTPSGQYEATFFTDPYYKADRFVKGDTASMAICLAALKALNIEIKEQP